jgi:hypothetical protein
MKSWFTGNPKDAINDFYVVFTFNNARIVVNPPEIERMKWEGAHIVAKNPDLSAVQGFSPQYWKFVSGRVVPLTYPERVARSEHIEAFGVVNDFMPYVEQSAWKKSKAFFKVYGSKSVVAFFATTLGYLLGRL